MCFFAELKKLSSYIPCAGDTWRKTNTFSALKQDWLYHKLQAHGDVITVFVKF